MKKRYVPDLVKDNAICEANYWRLQKLLPDQENLETRLLDVHQGENRLAHIRFHVLDRFKYTFTVLVDYDVDNLPENISRLRLVVRMYHDVNMAEVVDCEKGSQLNGVYQYPNKTMYYSDEKSQLNQFLAECLGQCLSHGVEQKVVYKAPNEKT